MKYLFFLIVLTTFIACNSLKHPNCCNKTEECIIKIAEYEWVKTYGKEIYDKRPFIIHKKNDSIWIVEGTLPDDYEGGVPYAEININTCEIIEITHGK